MISSDHNKKDSLEEAILDALRAGKAEVPNDEAVFILESINKNGQIDPRKIEVILKELRDGVSPYHVLCEYPIPGTSYTLTVPRDIMPPGVDTSEMITAIRNSVKSCEPDWLVDIGCGSGVLGIVGLLACSHTQGVLIDIDIDACEAAHTNLVRLGLSSRATIICGDGLTFLSPGSVDLIVGNLPYVPTDDISILPARFSKYVPRRAIDGGLDGLDLFRRFMPQIHRVLSKTGQLILQVGAGQKEIILSLMGHGWAFVSEWIKTHPHLIVTTHL